MTDQFESFLAGSGIASTGRVAAETTRTDGWQFFVPTDHKLIGNKLTPNTRDAGSACAAGYALRSRTVFVVAHGADFHQYSISATQTQTYTQPEWFSIFVPNSLLFRTPDCFKVLLAQGNTNRAVSLPKRLDEEISGFYKEMVQGQAVAVQDEMLLAVRKIMQLRGFRQNKTNREPISRIETLAKVVGVIGEGLTSALTLPSLSQAASISERSLRKIFQEYFNLSPKQYITLRRLLAARAVLNLSTQDSITVTEVALRFGFSDVGRFASRYKNQFGELPSQSLANDKRPRPEECPRPEERPRPKPITVGFAALGP